MYLGIDVGGTKIEGIVFDKGKIIEHIKQHTEHTKEKFTEEIKSVVKKLLENHKVEGIGICFPGCVDREKGIVISMPALPHIKNVQIVKPLEREFKVPVKIENDGKCMVWGEYLWGKGKGTKNFVAMTLGTGVGGGVVVDGKLYIGNGNAMEVGHTNIDPKGFKCFCGSQGCLEEYASGRAVMRFSKQVGIKAKDPYEVEVMARKGNKKAIEVHKKIGYYLGIGISSLIKTLDPDLIVLSGSISNASELFLKETKKVVDDIVWFPHCDIKVSDLKSAPAVGAASLFHKIK